MDLHHGCLRDHFLTQIPWCTHTSSLHHSRCMTMSLGKILVQMTEEDRLVLPWGKEKWGTDVHFSPIDNQSLLSSKSTRCLEALCVSKISKLYLIYHRKSIPFCKNNIIKANHVYFTAGSICHKIPMFLGVFRLTKSSIHFEMPLFELGFCFSSVSFLSTEVYGHIFFKWKISSQVFIS